MLERIYSYLRRMRPYGEDAGRKPRQHPISWPYRSCSRVTVGTVTLCGGEAGHRMEIEWLTFSGQRSEYRMNLQRSTTGDPDDFETVATFVPADVEDLKALLDESMTFIGTLQGNAGARELLRVRIGPKTYYVDDRLKELRNVDNPHDRIAVGGDR